MSEPLTHLPDTGREEKKANGESDPQDPERRHPDWPLIGFGIILLMILVGLSLVLYIVCAFYIKKPPQDTIAFITGAVGILAFGATAVYTFFSIRQWQEIKQQAIAATEQSNKMQLHLNEMKVQGELLNWQAAQTESQLVLARHQAIETIRQREMVQDHFNITNRPLLGIDNIKWDRKRPNFGMDDGRFWRVFVNIKNFGNTAAFDIQTDVTLKVIPFVALSDPCPDPIGQWHFHKRSKGTLPAKAKASIGVETDPLTRENITNVRKGLEWIMLWVDVTYTDRATGKTHVLRHHANFNLVGFRPCELHCHAD